MLLYENALAYELTKHFNVARQAPLTVYYDDIAVGKYYADIIVNESIVIELKSVDSIKKEHIAQLVNYLRATNLKVGLLINFGREPNVRRVMI